MPGQTLAPAGRTPPAICQDLLRVAAPRRGVLLERAGKQPGRLGATTRADKLREHRDRLADRAAGSLFGIPKSRLKPEEFGQISKAVPGMDSLLKAAPSAASAVGTAGALGGSAAGLPSRREVQGT